MASIVATPLPALGIVKIIVDWTPLYLDDLINVYRTTPDGVVQEVIGSPLRLSGGQAILYDTTAPFDVPVTYSVELYRPVIVRDQFQRNVNPTWGTPDLGGTYVVRQAPSTQFAVFGTYGAIGVNALNTPSVISTPTAYTNVLVEVSVYAPAQITSSTNTGSAYSSVYLRYIDSLNFYQFIVGFHYNNTVTVRIMRRQTTPSVLTLLGEVLIQDGYFPGEEFRLYCAAHGSTLGIKAWGSQTDRSQHGWTFATTDTTHTGPGYIGFGGQAITGVTNALPLVFPFDNLRATLLETESLTGTPVTLEAGRDGWLRDPQEPARSVRMDNCASHTFECLDAERFVFFQGLDDEAYESATGVFEVVNSEFPLTVAQTRKSAATSVRMVSTTLSDIPALKALFSPGRDLLLSLPADYGWGIESYNTLPVTVGDVQVSRLNRRDMRKPARLWTLPVRVTEEEDTYPDGGGGSNGIPAPGATYQDMEDTGLTYGQLATGGKSYIEWSQGVFT